MNELPKPFTVVESHISENPSGDTYGRTVQLDVETSNAERLSESIVLELSVRNLPVPPELSALLTDVGVVFSQAIFSLLHADPDAASPLLRGMLEQLRDMNRNAAELIRFNVGGASAEEPDQT